MKANDQTDRGEHVHKLTEREIKASISEAIEEFSEFLSLLHRRFATQLPHALLNNVPRGLVRFESLPKHAMRVALVAAIGEYLSWDEAEVANLAADILEDSNLHDPAGFIRERLGNDGNV